MAVKTMAELEDKIAEVTRGITGLSGSEVIIAYSLPGQPYFEPVNNRVFINLEPLSSPIDKQKDYFTKDLGGAHTNSDYTIAYTRVIRCNYVVYGPQSFDIADQLNCYIREPSARKLLRAFQVYPIAQGDPAVQSRESINDRWFQRADLKVDFNVGVSRTSQIFNFASITVGLRPSSGGPSQTIVITP